MDTIEQLYQKFLKSTGVCTDTRVISPGCMFFALRGPRFNANEYVGEALQKGAAFAVVDDSSAAVDERCILVQDALAALQLLARHHRRTFDIPVLGITGSNGKTTTKELIYAVMSADRPTLATEGNLNNHIGVPLTLLRLHSEHRFAIIEMGANKPGDIAELTHIAEPTHGLITNIGKAHLEGFGGFEGVVRTKSELYQWLVDKHAIAFVNGDDPLLCELGRMLPETVFYGVKPKNQFQGEAVEGLGTLSFWFRGTNGRRVDVRTKLIGSYNLPNALAAGAVGRRFGVQDAVIAGALEAYVPENNRSQLIDTGRNQVILDAYNANPTSMEAALRNLALIKTPLPKLAVIGDMLELGDEGPAEHRRIAKLCGELGLEAIYVGPLFQSVASGDSNEVWKDATALAASWEQEAPEQRYMLLKGSRGMKLERLLPLL